jgi:K(+)-stimulated pyrophosphate-energized sodium pump
LGEALTARPSSRIRITGYTDNTGEAASNQQLSQARADQVKALLADRGVAPERIETAGLGQEKPMFPNDTPEGRARNRRIEIEILSR